jgi:hyperosmotically inducible protein
MKMTILIMATSVLAAGHLAGCDRPADDGRTSKSPPITSTPDTAPGARPSNPTAGQGIDDAAITAKVKTALLAEKGVSGTDINVDTAQGTVTLSGRVADASQIDRAAQVAKEVEGVKTVLNKLTVGAS